jgi:PAS domain S-box-containing protein
MDTPTRVLFEAIPSPCVLFTFAAKRKLVAQTRSFVTMCRELAGPRSTLRDLFRNQDESLSFVDRVEKIASQIISESCGEKEESIKMQEGSWKQELLDKTRGETMFSVNVTAYMDNGVLQAIVAFHILETVSHSARIREDDDDWSSLAQAISGLTIKKPLSRSDPLLERDSSRDCRKNSGKDSRLVSLKEVAETFGDIPLPLCIVSKKDGMVRHVNRMMVDLFFAEEEGKLLFMKLSELVIFGEDNGDWIWECKKSEVREVLCRRLNGEKFVAEIAIMPLKFMKEKHCQLILRDISPDKAVARRLSSLTKEQTLILETIRQIVFVIRTPNSIGTMNQAFSEFFGCETEGILESLSVGAVFTHEEVSIQLQENKRVLEEGKRVTTERWITNASGERRYFRVHKIPRMNTDGSVAFGVCMMEDVTSHHQMQEDVVRLLKFDSLSMLISGIAHDFNNLLTAILGNISLVAMDMDTTSDEYEMLQDAELASHRAKELVRELVTFSGSRTNERIHLDVVDAARSAGELALCGSDVSFVFSAPKNEENICMMGDMGQVQQMVHNIVTNAREASKPGATVSVEVKTIRIADESEHAILGPGPYVSICVHDEGKGIQSVNMSKVFDPYFTTKERCDVKGSGLGLSLALSVARAHGGHISLTSEEKKGTTFEILLPRVFEEDATPMKRLAEVSIIEPEFQFDGRVLLMDDEPILVALGKRLLESCGLAVDGVSNGGGAINMYNKMVSNGTPYDMVILDLTIRGGMGAVETLKKMLEVDPDVKAVIVSGHVQDPVVTSYRQNGFVGRIRKPYSLKDVLRVVQRVLGNDPFPPSTPGSGQTMSP